MSALDEYFAHYEGGRPQHPLYGASIRTMYDCLKQEILVTPAQVLNILDYTHAEARGYAHTFLTRECGHMLGEISDRYITPGGERSEFLGFKILDKGSGHRTPMLLCSDDLGDAGKARLRKSVADHRAAGAGTVTETMPNFIDRTSWRFIPKSDIWLNAEQQEGLEHIRMMREEFDARILKGIDAIESVTASMLHRVFHRGRVAAYRKVRDDLHEICRKHTDACADSDAQIYAEAMGKVIDDQRDQKVGTTIVIQRTLLRQAEIALEQ